MEFQNLYDVLFAVSVLKHVKQCAIFHKQLYGVYLSGHQINTEVRIISPNSNFSFIDHFTF